MNIFTPTKQSFFPKRFLSALTAFFFLGTSVFPNPTIAQTIPQTILNLPIPGSVVAPTAGFAPAMIKGVNLYPDNPLKFDFIIDKGDAAFTDEEFKKESTKLIKYFLSSLTVPEDEMWVNLSPYEKNRIVPQDFGKTEMGRDLLAQDYMLKQLTASLMNPDDKLGGEFWQRVYTKAQEKYGTTDIPMNTFNKIWIVPEKAVVYEHEKGAFVVKSHLKVMLEEDYLALDANKNSTKHGLGDVKVEDLKVVSGVQSAIIKDLLIPEIEKEVNEGQTFANLRQIYNAVILASWYKQALKESLLGQVYIDQKKTKGVETDDKTVNEQIYNQYVESFKKGVYNYVKEDYNPETQEVVNRKYFSGGIKMKADMASLATESTLNLSSGDLASVAERSSKVVVDLASLSSPETVDAQVEEKVSDQAQLSALLNRRTFIKYLGLGTGSAVAAFGGGVSLWRGYNWFFKESIERNRKLDQLLIKYKNLPGAEEYIEFMREFLSRKTAKDLESLDMDYGNDYKREWQYSSLAKYLSLFFMAANLPQDLLELFPQEDVDFVFFSGNEKLRNNFIERFLSTPVKIEHLETVAKSNLTFKPIAEMILNELGDNREVLKKVQQAVDEVIQERKSLEPLKDIEDLIKGTTIKEDLRLAYGLLGDIIARENELALRLFITTLASAAYDNVLNRLGIKEKTQRENITNELFKYTSVKYTPEAYGEVQFLGQIILSFNKAKFTGEIINTATHEALHRIAYDKEMREQMNIKLGDDIRWLLSSALGYFNQYETAGSYSEKQAEKLQGLSPLETHARIRNIANDKKSWIEAHQVIVENKGGKTFGDEPRASYEEGHNLALYALNQYGSVAGALLIRAYGVYHDQLSFGEMEAAAGILKNVMAQYSLSGELYDLEESIIEKVRGQISDDILYPELMRKVLVLTEASKDNWLSSGLMSLKQDSPESKVLKGGVDLSSDAAMTGTDTKGGIDLNPTILSTEIKRNGRGVIIPAFRGVVPDLKGVEGFVPNIINVTPVTNLQLLLGLETKSKENPAHPENDKPVDVSFKLSKIVVRELWSENKILSIEH